MTTPIEQILQYHRATKHAYDRYAPGPHGLDWANQPDPFRRYEGALLLPLEHIPVPPSAPAAQTHGIPADIPYDQAYGAGGLPPAPLNRHSLSRLLYDSLALSAWKRAGNTSWSLRINPSSGNLHPTEATIVCGAVEGLHQGPMVAHYAPREHALELRAELPPELWRELSAGLPEDGLLLGLSSIHWREAWKYGERAYRYCQLDVGHALGAIAMACAALGWRATLLEGFGDDRIRDLLGLNRADTEDGERACGAEPEHPDCLLAITPYGTDCGVEVFGDDLAVRLAALDWRGRPNRLSAERVHWPLLEGVVRAAAKPPTAAATPPYRGPDLACPGEVGTRIGLRDVVHRRRSAVDMTPSVVMEKAVFYRMLCRTLAAPHAPFESLPWPPQIDLALFVHRVSGVEPGLYWLLRDPGRGPSLRAALRQEFEWERLADTPAGMGLYRLAGGATMGLARQLSCHQDIAANGCFSLGMVARFLPALEQAGPWFYRRLYWEAGTIGQVLYLEACASGIAATGIGCFFDDPMHQLLGITNEDYQSLYHFTVGAPVDDPRLSTLPPY